MSQHYPAKGTHTFRRPKSPKVLRLFLWFDIAVVAAMLFFCNPVMLHKCGFLDGPGLGGIGARPFWFDRILMLENSYGFVLEATTADQPFESYNHWVKGGQQFKTITGYGLTLPHKKPVYIKAMDWSGVEQTFVLTKYSGTSDYAYELTKRATATPSDVWWWVSMDLKNCKVGDINLFGPWSVLIFILLCFMNLILRGTHAFDLPVRVLKWAAINPMPDDKAGRRR